jgi:hypothetical protein
MNDVSEELMISIIKMERINELGAMVTVSSNSGNADGVIN